MKRKALIIIGLLVVITSVIGISYASWLFKSTQNNFNTMGSKCFEVRIIDETEAITINKAYPITDEEGLKETGYTFTIKNTCNTSATYEVNLEDIVTEEKRLSGEYIKVSINNGAPEVLTEKEEKTPTIEEADKAYLLTSGSLLPEEEATYTLKLWMDESTPAIEETMNATFLSKISIEAGYIEENALENELTIEAVSETESINKESETFKISGTSSKYNIIEYSEDKSHWTRVKDVNKTFEIEKTYTQEGTYNFYIKDEVGNIKETTITTSKLDQTKPTIEMEVITEEEKISLNLTLKDGKSGISGYQVTTSEEEPNNWVSISGNETTINYEITSNDTYYIWLKDVAGNITYKTYTSTTIDNQAPELEITNELSEWGIKDKIIIKGTDDVTGISAYSVSKEESIYEWIAVEESSLTFEKEIEIEENGTYYVSIKDGYGHITTKSIVIDKIDNILPVTESLTSDNEWGKTNHIVGMLKDNESGLKDYQITSEETEPKEYIEISGNSYEINYEVNKNGTYYIWVKDQNENIYKTSIEVTKVDNVVPTNNYSVGTNTVGDNGWYKALTINTTLSDNESGVASAKYCITTNNTCVPNVIATINENSFSVQLESNASAQKICVITTDNVGNESTTNCSDLYKVDNINPSIRELASSSEWGKTNTITAKTTDLESGIIAYTFTTNSDVPTSFTSVNKTNGEQIYTYSASTNGTYYFWTKDEAGNISNKSVVVNKIDTTAPTITHSALSNIPGNNGWYKAFTFRVNLFENETGIAKAQYCITSAASCVPNLVANVTNNYFDVSLSDGKDQKICVQATDNAGNVSGIACSGTFSVDNTIPTANIILDANLENATVSLANITDNISGIAYYQYSKDNSTWYTSSANTYTFTMLANGTYTFYARAVDNAGNILTLSSQATIATHYAQDFYNAVLGSKVVIGYQHNGGFQALDYSGYGRVPSVTLTESGKTVEIKMDAYKSSNTLYGAYRYGCDWNYTSNYQSLNLPHYASKMTGLTLIIGDYRKVAERIWSDGRGIYGDVTSHTFTYNSGTKVAMYFTFIS